MPKKELKMILSELLKPWMVIPAEFDRPISGLSLDSRNIQPGDLFIARFGTQKDGTQYISDAKKRGAVAALIHLSNKLTSENTFDNSKILLDQTLDITDNFPIIPIADLDDKLGLIAARYYDYPANNMKIIGVTGTNGKTTITQLIANALALAGENAAVVGTLGYGMAGDLKSGSLTTPDVISLQQYFAEFRERNTQYVALEASSHGLDQAHRLAGINFDIGIFTNLTRDHLDYHHTMDNYAAAKHKLFERANLRYSIFNLDDPYGQEWAIEFHNRFEVYGYTLDSTLVNKKLTPYLIWADNIHLSDNGISAVIHTPWGEGILQSKLLARFNLSNILAVITTLGILKIPLPDMLNYLMQLSGAPGRMQAVGGDYYPLVVIDYAHTPDALAQALQALREHCSGKLWCVFGCGGDRDTGKRSLMGTIATTYADEVIVTDDNPRTENPQQIVADIMQGIQNTNSVIIEHDRHLAIAHAINCAQSGDIVLIAGKGHEAYQQIGEEKIQFSDLVEAKLCLVNKDT